MFRSENCRSNSDNKDMESESSATSSFIGEESADFTVSEEKVTRKENDSHTLASVSPMNTSDEEPLHNSDSGKFKLNIESPGNKSKVILLNSKLRREIDTLSVRIIELRKENGCLQKKLEGFENGRSIEERRRTEELDSLQKSMDDRDSQVKELWNVIQMLDNENMELKIQSEKCQERQKQLNSEIIGLKCSNARADITVSDKAANWKNILDKELSSLGNHRFKDKRQRDLVSKNKISGRCERRGESNMRKTSRHVQKNLISFNPFEKTEITNDKAMGKKMSSVNYAFEDKMLQKNIVKKAEGAVNEQVNNGSDWSNEELSCGNKRSTWGSGLWPPEWTTVPNVHYLKNWCENSKV